MISLLPMAGRGNRFKAEGYQLPKPFIPIMNMPMFLAAIKSFPPADKHILIGLEEFEERYSFSRIAAETLPNCTTLTIGEVSGGQACTCLMAESLLEPEEALIISGCDCQLVYDEKHYRELLDDVTIDVIVWTFQIGSIKKKSPTAFAYCRTEGDRVVEVVEKRTISDTPHLDPAVVGTFTYRRSRDFIFGAKKMIERSIRVNNEFYVGTSINQLIENGKRVVIFPVQKFISFGDPFELQLYQAWEEYFFTEESHPYSG